MDSISRNNFRQDLQDDLDFLFSKFPDETEKYNPPGERQNAQNFSLINAGERSDIRLQIIFQYSRAYLSHSRQAIDFANSHPESWQT
jgi:hypothetical protein